MVEEHQKQARRRKLDLALMEYLVQTETFVESWIELERIRDKFLINDEDRALYGFPPVKEVKRQVRRASKKL